MARATAVVLVVVLVSAGCLRFNEEPEVGELPSEPDEEAITVVADGLRTIWHIAFAPDGRLLLTERGSSVRVVHPDRGLDPTPWATLDVLERGESGLMGLALHPSFATEPYVYLHYSTGGTIGETTNRIVRIPEENGRGGDEEVLLDGIPGSQVHDGGRIAFGPDGMLYATTGDAAVPARSQDPTSLAGKVLRIAPDGSVPPDNPNDSSHVYTMGHRNPQGIAFHPDSDTPFISEHGPENHDEVNVLAPGANYGWPVARGDDPNPLFTPSIWSSGPGGTIAPAGAAFIDAPGSPLDRAFVFVALKAAHVHVLSISDDAPYRVTGEHVLFDGDFGRLRAATWGPDGALYLGTSNHDGRGDPGPQDDRVLRVPLSVLEAEAGVAQVS